MRHDIFLMTPKGEGDYGSNWRCYVQAVTVGSGKRICETLERQGETVLITTHGKNSGRCVYQSPQHFAA